MRIRSSPNHASQRRKKKSQTSRRRARGVWNQITTLVKMLAHQYASRQRPTELTIVLRLINILGLALIVTVIALLVKNESIEEIANLAKELFRLIP
jgi:hypothetical protein